MNEMSLKAWKKIVDRVDGFMVTQRLTISRSDLKEFVDEIYAERDLCDRLAEELNRHGHGDIHYGDQTQESKIVALVQEHKDRRGVVQ